MLHALALEVFVYRIQCPVRLTCIVKTPLTVKLSPGECQMLVRKQPPSEPLLIADVQAAFVSP